MSENKGTLKTQGTELFTVDSLSAAEAAVLKLACPTGITGLGGAASQIDQTDLDSAIDQESRGGLGAPGQVTVPFNLKPKDGSHQILFDLKASGDVLQWLIGFSDGTAKPTLVDGDLVAPAAPNRTSAKFRAYVADVNIDIASNEIVRGTLTLQRSGSVEWFWNGPQ